ncbi:MAG: glycosyltransferase family 39 protein [Nitrososphaeraceae archaeon]|nr:glycosyltransferase family 39 protein [Nitrososphaeraceae archaeon]
MCAPNSRELTFPPLHPDEGHYMRRAMQVLKGMGPQESTKTYPYPYDHPYFGQLFLAAALDMVGYPPPHILNPSSSFSHSSTTVVSHNLVNSIEMLYLVPMVLTGLLAIVDTFLVYKTAERRYGRNVAVIASVLFAVMPSLLYNRWILLDNILMFFLLYKICEVASTIKLREKII